VCFKTHLFWLASFFCRSLHAAALFGLERRQQKKIGKSSVQRGIEREFFSQIGATKLISMLAPNNASAVIYSATFRELSTLCLMEIMCAAHTRCERSQFSSREIQEM
jgi:hypothetical protein